MKRIACLALALAALQNNRCIPLEEAEAAPPVTYGSGIRRVLDEGTLVTGSAGSLNCVGDGIACTVSGNTVIATVSGGGGGGSGYQTIQEEGSDLAQEETLNFVGGALTAAAGSGKTNVTLSASPDSASVVGTGRTLTAGTCVSALGDLSANRTVAVDVGCSPTWTAVHTFSLAPVLSAGSQSALGDAATPAYTFTGDLNTGMYSAGADTLNWSTGGTLRATLDSTGLTVASVVKAADGTAGAPAHTFSSDADNGVYLAGANQVGIATAGTSRFTIDGSAAALTVPARVGSGSASAPGLSFQADTNTGFARVAADTLTVSTNGAEVARWDSSGNFGVGVTPTARMSVKNHANFAGSERNTTTAAVQTTDTTVTSVFTLTLADNTLYFFEASCVARDTAGSERAYYRRAVRAHRQGGGGATAGTVDTGFSDESNAGLDLTWDASSNDIRLRATGLGSTTIAWTCSVVYQGVSTSS